MSPPTRKGGQTEHSRVGQGVPSSHVTDRGPSWCSPPVGLRPTRHTLSQNPFLFFHGTQHKSQRARDSALVDSPPPLVARLQELRVFCSFLTTVYTTHKHVEGLQRRSLGEGPRDALHKPHSQETLCLASLASEP